MQQCCQYTESRAPIYTCTPHCSTVPAAALLLHVVEVIAASTGAHAQAEHHTPCKRPSAQPQVCTHLHWLTQAPLSTVCARDVHHSQRAAQVVCGRPSRSCQGRLSARVWHCPGSSCSLPQGTSTQAQSRDPPAAVACVSGHWPERLTQLQGTDRALQALVQANTLTTCKLLHEWLQAVRWRTQRAGVTGAHLGTLRWSGAAGQGEPAGGGESQLAGAMQGCLGCLRLGRRLRECQPCSRCWRRSGAELGLGRWGKGLCLCLSVSELCAGCWAAGLVQGCLGRGWWLPASVLQSGWHCCSAAVLGHWAAGVGACSEALWLVAGSACGTRLCAGLPAGLLAAAVGAC